MKRYDVLLLDPPWSYNDTLPGNGRGAESHYTVLDDKSLLALPVANRAADDCALFLWATGPRLPLAIRCIEAWGFDYVTVAFDWEKVTKDGRPGFGMGRWTRSAHEFVLLGRRGRPSRVSASVRQTVRARPLKHSAKPPEVRERIVELMGDVPRLELFARDKAEGWDATGLELDGLDIMEALCPQR